MPILKFVRQDTEVHLDRCTPSIIQATPLKLPAEVGLSSHLEFLPAMLELGHHTFRFTRYVTILRQNQNGYWDQFPCLGKALRRINTLPNDPSGDARPDH